jgi:hypothetical protein
MAKWKLASIAGGVLCLTGFVYLCWSRGWFSKLSKPYSGTSLDLKIQELDLWREKTQVLLEDLYEKAHREIGRLYRLRRQAGPSLQSEEPGREPLDGEEWTERVRPGQQAGVGAG